MANSTSIRSASSSSTRPGPPRNMARRHGRCPRGERLRIGVPHGHWKTTTFVGALTLRGFIAPWVLDGPINRAAFETYVAKVLVPELRRGDIVVMDNLSSHKGAARTRVDRGRWRRAQILPPYSPDFNPIENAFAKLRPCSERPLSEPWTASGPRLAV